MIDPNIIMKLMDDLARTRREFRAAGHFGSQEAALREKLRRAFPRILQGFLTKFIQCHRMCQLSPSLFEKKIQKTSQDKTKLFYIGCNREISHYLWEAEPQSKRWLEIKMKYRKACTYYCHAGEWDETCTVERLIRQYCGISPQCLNVKRTRANHSGIIFLLIYKLNRYPGEWYHHFPPVALSEREENVWALEREIIFRICQMEDKNELVQFLKTDFFQVMGKYPHYLKQCRAMTEFHPSLFLQNVEQILCGLKRSEGFLVGILDTELISLRPYLWEIGSAKRELEAYKKVHTYFTKVDGTIDVRRFLEKKWWDPRCLNNRTRWYQGERVPIGSFLYLVKFYIGRPPLMEAGSHCKYRKLLKDPYVLGQRKGHRRTNMEKKKHQRKYL
ncbi:uncharacterized protein LOC120405818 [Mauremys reevesii]|uniref:uncharacterized protein LOC120405818 n=1 Tax=Mauremys reevesii TaxID=260615 RepID=UPI00193EC8E7|nr:uncharacterized protein LOC120405818 [Mauremys reevesii]XP_039395549.1 uncharacterized protein LOC120405818 [Mauremys reevesii]XP_039395556.1 uncharacterized protein LOC120405818 [Mauremys reevesii]XP_039395567.1 uncharacterized protein LOC120405818 [Mauremys reevesii]